MMAHNFVTSFYLLELEVGSEGKYWKLNWL